LRASCRYWEWVFTFWEVEFTLSIRQKVFYDFYEKNWAFSYDQSVKMAGAHAVSKALFMSIIAQAVAILFSKPFSISLTREWSADSVERWGWKPCRLG
jgi:hypothetical protein